MKLSPGKLDLLFILPAIVSIRMIADTPNKANAAFTLDPVMQGIMLVAGTILIGFLILLGSDLDRRFTEDYLFQMLANAALIAVGTTALINMFWLGAMQFYQLPELTAQNITGVMVLAFFLGYYLFRFRGVKP